MTTTEPKMKQLPIGTPGYQELSIRFHGLDAAKDEASSFAKSVLRGGSFTADQIVIMSSPCRSKWCVGARKDAIGKRLNRNRDDVRNPHGYRVVETSASPSC